MANSDKPDHGRTLVKSGPSNSNKLAVLTACPIVVFPHGNRSKPATSLEYCFFIEDYADKGYLSEYLLPLQMVSRGIMVL